MRVSLNQIKRYIDFELPANDTLIININQQLGGVEDSYDFGSRYEGAVIVRIDSCEKHPNADKLNICQVDDGTGELTQVVCGAPNVHAGMFAVWLKPGSTVPSSVNDKEPFVLGARELRGVMSNGMLASPKELGLGDSHDGILEIDPSEQTTTGVDIAAGLSFANTFGLDDSIIEIENKMFTHRPDLFGQLGVAREIAGIHGHRFASPDWYYSPRVDALPVASDALPLTVFNEAETAAPRFMAIALKGIEVKPSPLWLQCALVSMGGKPINNIVDLTNYIMLTTAQPTHAYDYDKLRGAMIGARMAQAGEQITLLNGKSYQLDAADIVISDGEGPIGLAGIMGGGNSEVSDATTNLVLEVASFDMYTLRRSSMRHGVFTDALTRFNKGQSPYQNRVVLCELVRMIQEVAGGEIASETFDTGNGLVREYKDKLHLEAGSVTADFINERLGTTLNAEEIATLLRNVEFDINSKDGAIDYRAPFWRTDIVEAEDIVEEVGRLYGFDRLPRILPSRSTKPAPLNPTRQLKLQLRRELSRAGANEVLTYSFVNGKLIVKAGQDSAHAYELSNALSPDLQFYRLSLTPSLLDKVSSNFRAGYDMFGLFELGKSHFKNAMDQTEPSVPHEGEQLALVIAGSNPNNGAAYYSAKRYFDQTIQLRDGYEQVSLSSYTIDDEWGAQLVAPYDKDRSVAIVKNGRIWGVVGEFNAAVHDAFKLPDYAAGFEIHLDAVDLTLSEYVPLSRFPGTSRDISLKVAADTPYQSLRDCVESVLDTLDSSFATTITPLSVYKADGDDRKTVTFRITFVNAERTLKDDEVTIFMKTIADRCSDELDASVV